MKHADKSLLYAFMLLLLPSCLCLKTDQEVAAPVYLSSSAVMHLVLYLVPFIPRWINAFAVHPYSFSLISICSSVLCEPCPKLQDLHVWSPQSIGGVQLSTCRNLSFSILNTMWFLSTKLKYLMENTTSSCWLGLSNIHCWEVQNMRRNGCGQPTGTKHDLPHILLPTIELLLPWRYLHVLWVSLKLLWAGAIVIHPLGGFFCRAKTSTGKFKYSTECWKQD